MDVAQDSIITSFDCGSSNGIRMRAIVDAGQVVASLAIRILGRFTAEDLLEQDGKTVIVKAGEMIQESAYRPHQCGRHPGSEDPVRADLRSQEWLLRGLLRTRSGARHARQHGRGGRRSSRRSRSVSRAPSLPCAFVFVFVFVNRRSSIGQCQSSP